MSYPSLEHAYQAAKTSDPNIHAQILLTVNPGAVKRLTRTKKFKQSMRMDWDQVKLQIMEDLTLLKYKDPVLRRKLLATGDAQLVEGNTWGDTFWGVCDGQGDNHLGQILMRIRAEIAAEG